jgi:hypothetical protein
LGEQERSAWKRDGFFVLRGLYSPAVLNAVRPKVNGDDREHIFSDASLSKHVVFGAVQRGGNPNKISKLEQLQGLSMFGDLFALATDWRLKLISQQLIGVDATLMKDKYIFKASLEGDAFLPHQDMQYVYSRFAKDAVNFYIAFDDADEENGALQVVPGLQEELHGRIIVEQTERYPIPENIAENLNFVAQPLQQGDVLCFSAFTPHRSAPNLSTRHRAVYYPTYAVPPSHRCAGAIYDDYYEYAWEWWRTNNEKNPDDDLIAGKSCPTLHPTGYVLKGTGH